MFVIIFFISIAGSTYGRRAAACIWLPTVTFSMKTAVRTRAASPGDAPGHTKKPSGVKSHCASGMVAPAVYVPSRTGKSLLLHDGYTFYLKNLQAHGRKQWYCSSRDMAGCRADVITAPARTGNGDILFLVRGRHIHGPPSYYFTPDGKYVRKKDVYHRYR
ncbi:uncharacterized protein LOC119190050 isoform X1 [Manduca sexta]|uniref:FLYWCH-type domain-containing protein n=1 Tax=Manduca sexta TaxID=7130 RepID=A0A922CDF9_MANSE|nr:uncharacterized protein LOC119190050 isoform X1 [Manduca sexta]KAG6441739.1 hypothetical protein O3G_MSEX001966 [Manduca sexta]